MLRRSSRPRPDDRSLSWGSARVIRPSQLNEPAVTDPNPGPHLRLGSLGYVSGHRVFRQMLMVSEPVGGTGQSRSHLARYITPTVTGRNRPDSVRILQQKQSTETQTQRNETIERVVQFSQIQTMPTTPLTIRPPKRCSHAYYALDPAIYTARIIAILIWAT
jgi:hypothetical protein